MSASNDWPAPGPFGHRPPDQIAYVVPELESAVQILARRLGVADWNVWVYDDAYVGWRTYLGQPGDYRSLVAMPAYGPSLEIIQPIDGPSIYTTFLADRGPGLHHVGYYVDSIAQARGALDADGVIEVMSGGGHGMDGDGAFVFFDLLDVAGSYLELIEAPARRHGAHRTIRAELG